MKLATALSIILPVVSVTADTFSVNQARLANPNLRGGHTHHHHETGSLIKEFREQRVHKKDVQDEEVDSDNAIVDNAVVGGDGIAAAGNEESVGPGKYFNEQEDNNGSDYSRHEKSLAARKKKAEEEQQHQQIFRTSRLSRTEMEAKATDMELKLIQVEEGTLQLSSKTIERYKKFVARYNELEKEIYYLDHPEEKKKDEEESMADDTKNNKDGTKGDTEMNKKTTSSAYSSGKAEYEKSIEQMKEKKEIDELIHKEKKVMEVGVGEEEKKGKDVMDVTNADADEADVFPEKVDKVSTKTMEVVGEEKPSSKYADRDTVDDDEIIDSLEIPSEQNGKIKGEITVTGRFSKEEDDDDDIPPNFEGLVDGKASDPLEKAAPKETGSTKQLSVPANISVENSLEKVKKLVETVDTTPKKKMADDIEEESSTVENTVSTQLNEGGNDNESEDAGTKEMDRALLEKLGSEKVNADGESEGSKGEKKASAGN